MNDLTRRALFGLLAGAPVAVKAAHTGESQCKECGRWQDDWFFNHGWQLCEQCTDVLKPLVVAQRECGRALDRLEAIDDEAALRNLVRSPEWRKMSVMIHRGVYTAHNNRAVVIGEFINAFDAVRTLALKSLPT